MFSKCVREVLFKRQAFNAARSLFYTGYDAKNIVILQSSIQGHFTKAPARSFSVSYCEKNAAAKDLKCSEDSEQMKEAKGDFMNSRLDKNVAIQIKDQGNTRFISYRKKECMDKMQHAIYGGRDVIVQARTSSKIMEHYVSAFWTRLTINIRDSKHPRMLVLIPTGELANQVAWLIRKHGYRLNVVFLNGGASISYQEHQLKMGADIVVGTPGVIVDLIQKGSLNISKLNHVVFDEVDTMISMGFTDDMDMILGNRYCTVKRDENPQTLFISATMPSWVHDTMEKYLSRGVKKEHKKNEAIDEGRSEREINRLRKHMQHVRESTTMKFEKDATELLKNYDPVDILTTTLALAAGYEQRSLINYELGLVTLKFTSDTRVHDSYHAFKLLPEILANEVRNIRMCKGNESFVFDVPICLEEKYNESTKNEYINNVSVIECLPSLVSWEN